MPDALDAWLRVRATVPWNGLGAAEPPVHGPRDGAREHFRVVEHARSPRRAAGLLTALDLLRADAEAGRELDFTLLAGWQRHVLEVADAPFRTGPAFAKQGRERYGTAPDLRERFDSCLTGDPVPVLPRAARTYLDVCFFHPFEDGNGRAALLALLFVLHRAGIVLDHLGPLPAVARRADDPDGAVELVRLLEVLVRQTRRRAVSGPGRPAASRCGPDRRPRPGRSG